MKNNNLVIIGYSGHSYLCIETAINIGISVDGYYDIEEKFFNPYNLKYLGKETDLNITLKPFITVGDNSIRKKIYEKLLLNNVFLDLTLIHPNAVISNSSFISNQTFISAGAIINSQVIIGKGCIVNTGAIIEHECQIGDFSHIGPNATICGNVNISDNVFIGANAVVKEGVKVGENSIIGAGSVVLKNVPANSIWVGNPAKKIIYKKIN